MSSLVGGAAVLPEGLRQLLRRHSGLVRRTALRIQQLFGPKDYRTTAIALKMLQLFGQDYN
jgi:hypothetical protein